MAQGALLLIALAADFVNERSRQKALRVKVEVPSKIRVQEGA
jgi:hypothetical protein